VSPATDEGLATDAVGILNRYLREEVTLDALIEWAESLEAAPSDDTWLRHVVQDLSNPLLCREQARALVYEHLRSRAPVRGRTSS
jgi:hypothetical protein